MIPWLGRQADSKSCREGWQGGGRGGQSYLKKQEGEGVKELVEMRGVQICQSIGGQIPEIMSQTSHVKVKQY